MYGAILGDIIGSPYEFDQGDKTKDFPLFSKRSELTDDTVMTIAVADAFLDAQPNAAPEWIRNRLVRGMQKWGKLFPYAGYGGMFRRWLKCDDPQPYGSFGNGSAMRVSAVAWLYNDLETVRAALEGSYTIESAEVTKIPSSYVTIDDEAALANMEKMLDYFDEDEDITAVYHNWEN